VPQRADALETLAATAPSRRPAAATMSGRSWPTWKLVSRNSSGRYTPGAGGAAGRLARKPEYDLFRKQRRSTSRGSVPV